eukprot:CAMPEP_0198606884 /NCGR_PEP_ID=MMETSP1462-20131121/155118_1 /TAXON_ID=1333877 /ORGANISM="Brandtodinium nutriculum, Strain RCC3387" /LENGTH=192 /DNA_ID=CAMNT_0044338689 /DNA_START=69 /DNA_END=647 /DNA_ORIENTATION=+
MAFEGLLRTLLALQLAAAAARPEEVSHPHMIAIRFVDTVVPGTCAETKVHVPRPSTGDAPPNADGSQGEIATRSSCNWLKGSLCAGVCTAAVAGCGAAAYAGSQTQILEECVTGAFNIVGSCKGCFCQAVNKIYPGTRLCSGSSLAAFQNGTVPDVSGTCAAAGYTVRVGTYQIDEAPITGLSVVFHLFKRP